MVCPDRLRFDFTHFTAPSPSELMRVEDLLNQKIWDNLPVIVEDVPLEEAKQKGAMALFGEKYGEIVRMVTIGEFSRELCGGNHVRATGEIGLAKVISESSIAAGLRRIEMVVGESAYRWVSQKESILEEVTQLLKTSPAELVNQIKKLQENLRQQEKKIASLRVKLALSQVESLLSQVQEVTGVKVLAARVEGLDMESLRKIADELRARLGSGVIVLGTPGDGRVDLITVVTKNLTSRLHAGEIARAVATIVGGSGGGRPDLGQAGGKYPEKLDEALRKVAQLIPTQENNIA
jgi:alanyl-tRNA synthetase